MSVGAGWLAARGLEPPSEAQAAPGFIASILPQRAPLLLLHRVLGVRGGPRPALAAAYDLAACEPVFAGHFPHQPIWPGSYTIEGLAQTAALAGGVSAPGQPAGLAMVVAVRVKLTAPIVPPACLIYYVALAHVTGAVARFDVEAEVAGRLCAQGSLDVLLAGAT